MLKQSCHLQKSSFSDFLVGYYTFQASSIPQLLRQHEKQTALLLANTKRSTGNVSDISDENALDYFVFDKLIDLAGGYLSVLHDLTGLGWCPTIGENSCITKSFAICMFLCCDQITG